MSAGVDSLPAVSGGQGVPRRAIGVWLIGIAVLVFAMVMLGGATRLTNSGLSMVHWQFAGSLPPLDETAWQAEFARYQLFPEYRKVNAGMSLPEFKRIYWFEYSHRMLGRLIGLAFALPMLWLVVRRRLDRRLALKLSALLVLGGLQGLVGWWMVQSGLIDHPDVDHLRLATHLGLASILLAALIWVGADELSHASGTRRTSRGSFGLYGAGWVVLGLAFLQILLGALVAGLNAGLVYNTFPTMGGYWLPPDVAATPFGDLLEEPVAVQFLHRVGAVGLTIGILLLRWAIRNAARAGGRVPLSADLVVAALFVQLGLGIATLLAAAPLVLALTHQAAAMILLATLVLQQHALGPGAARKLESHGQ